MNKLTVLFLSSLFCTAIQAAQTTVTITSTKDNKEIGQVVFSDSDFGLLIVPNLTSLPLGLHGFHLHQHPNCGDHGMDAGAHFDPQNANSHRGPYDKGHLGDLPLLYVGTDGKASTPTLAPRLKTTDLQGLSVMIHEGGDNYSDNPHLGGGGARIACGPVK